jgi:tetratricopeptide (TPR) repeat protein
MSDRRTLDLFEAALDRPPAQRAAFLDEAAAGDAALRERLDALLVAHARAGRDGFLEPEQACVPQTLGRYRLLERIGGGGMGQVYRAERRDDFEQYVAIKLLNALPGDPEAARRAEAERQFLAWIDHPNIARILDGGTTPHGQPYVVMEYVDGERIDRWCRNRALGPQARVRLFGQVLAAVDAAHRALIIHRDIKPGNVLVTEAGQVKLLDFGIAKSLDGRIRGEATQTGAIALTPGYASPEQLGGQPLTTACDVYALGLLLYELLTGVPALRTEGRSLVELAHWTSAHVPDRPSERLDTAALGLGAGVAADWRRALAGDLDRVVLKALQPEPLRRYASVQAFADDLVRWLEHRPVLARAGGWGYRGGKLLRRHWLPAAASALAVLGLAGGLAVALDQAGRARAEAERARRANAFLTDMIARADPYLHGRPPLLVDALDRAVEDIPRQLAGQTALEGDIRQALGQAYLSLERPDAARMQLDRAAALRIGEGGDALAETLKTQAMLEWNAGDTGRAEALLRQALAACSRGGAGDRQRAYVLSDYAALLGDLGRWDEARRRAEDSLALQTRAPGPDPARDRAVTLGNLASAEYGLGRYEAASANYARARALLETIEPLPELDLSINLNNQALLLDRLGRTAEALPLQERSIALKRKVMDGDFPRLAMPLAHLAGYYAALGRHEEAAATMHDALRLAPAAYGEDDARLGDLYVSAAWIAMRAGDASGATAAADHAEAIYGRVAADAVPPSGRKTLVEVRSAIRERLAQDTR